MPILRCWVFQQDSIGRAVGGDPLCNDARGAGIALGWWGVGTTIGILAGCAYRLIIKRECLVEQLFPSLSSRLTWNFEITTSLGSDFRVVVELVE